MEKLSSGDYSDPVQTNASIRKVLIGLSQTFGIPLRNLETYTKGVTKKLAPSVTETYESWFWKKTDKAYDEMIDEHLRGKDRFLADTPSEDLC